MAALSPAAWQSFFAQSGEIIRRDYDPYLYRYYRKLFDEPAEAAGFLRWSNILSHRCDPSGGVLLDAGCGFGITSVAFLATDKAPRQVVGVDPSEGKVVVMEKLASFFGLGEEQLKPVQGDAMDLDFPDASFDTVFIKDVASHVADRAGFFTEIARVLKPGGRLMFTDENNSLSIPGRKERAEIWRTAEEGPVPSDGWLTRPYVEERFAMFTEWRPELDEPTRKRLAQESKGMWGPELESAIRGWSPGSVFNNTADFPYRSPISGEYLEYLFNPFELARELGTYGLRGRVVAPAYRTGKPSKRLVGDVIAALHPLSIIAQSSFYIVATKTS